MPVGFEAPGVVRAATQATQLTAFLENANLLAVRTLLATAGAAEANSLDSVNEVVANPAGGPPVARPDSSYRARLNALLTELQDSVNYTNGTFSDDEKAAQFAMWSTLFKTAPAVDPATGLLMQYERAPAAIQRMETDLKAMARAVAQAMSTGLVEADVAAAVGAQITLTTTGNPDVTGADKIFKFLVADIVEFIDGTTVVTGSGDPDELYKDAKAALALRTTDAADRATAVGTVVDGMKQAYERVWQVVLVYASVLLYRGGEWYASGADASDGRQALAAANAMPDGSDAEKTAKAAALDAAYDGIVKSSRVAQQIYVNVRAAADLVLIGAYRTSVDLSLATQEQVLRERASGRPRGRPRPDGEATVGLKLLGFEGRNLALSGRYPLSTSGRNDPTDYGLDTQIGPAVADSDEDVYARYTLTDGVNTVARRLPRGARPRWQSPGW